MRSRRSAGVRVRVRVLAGLACMAAALFGLGQPVGAKGPESATITGPGIERPMELIDGTNPDLVALFMEQTGVWYGRGDLPTRLEAPPGGLGPSYTLTWINSGPPEKSVEERTIRQVLYLHAEHGLVIHTPDQEGLEGWGPDVIGWFAAPSGLRDTLEELGVPMAEGGRVARRGWMGGWVDGSQAWLDGWRAGGPDISGLLLDWSGKMEGWKGGRLDDPAPAVLGRCWKEGLAKPVARTRSVPDETGL